MKIKLPKEIHYYYEITPKSRGDRLLYCIPKSLLIEMVQQNQVEKSILEDYPLGVDIKVNNEHFEEYQNLYGMQFIIDPRIIYQAFQVFKSRWKKDSPKTGIIEKEFLEDIANQIKNKISDQPLEFPSVPDKLSNYRRQKRTFKTLQTVENRLKRDFKELKIRRFDPDIPIQEQSFTKVKMSKGSEPLSFFSKVQKK